MNDNNSNNEGTNRPISPKTERQIQENSYQPTTSELNDNNPPSEDSGSSDSDSD